MRRKITDLTEGDIEPPDEPEESEPTEILAQPSEGPAVEAQPPPSPTDPGTALMNMIAPDRGPPLVRPEDDRVYRYVLGKPVMASEVARFGAMFTDLLGFMYKVIGFDDTPEAQGSTNNYLRVTCPKCKVVTVTIAPRMEKFCSECGAPLPSPVRSIPTPRFTMPGTVDRENVVDAEYTVTEGDSNEQG